MKVKRVYFVDNERIGSGMSRHEHSREGMTFDPESGLLCVRVGDQMRFYSPASWRWVETEIESQSPSTGAKRK